MTARIPLTRVAVLVVTAIAALFTACGDSPTGPSVALEVLVAGGNEQYGTPGQRLEAPLEALVRRSDTGAHQKGIELDWAVERGDASLSASRTTTDAAGYARVHVQLGSRTDTVRVRATVRGQAGASALFVLHVAERPDLGSLSPTSVRAGDTVTLVGQRFAASAAQNVVLFSGIRGRVISADATTLRVEVPPCLPSGTVSVTAQLGTLVSGALPLTVEDAGRRTVLARGEHLDVDEREAVSCVRLPGGGAGYLVMAVSAGTVGAARYGYTLRGLEHATALAAPAAPPLAAPAPSLPPERGDFAALWEARLRAREDRHVRAAPVRPTPLPAPARAPVPSVGERRSFKVLNTDGGFDDVTAVARVVGGQAVIYVDESAPTDGGFTDAELQDFAGAFDEVIHPTVTGAYGMPSDLDGNDRIVILFTPTVNRLTERGADGFVGGFFYGLDLLESLEGSNKGEIFYAMVPDPAGIHSDARRKDRVAEVIPPILAHEFQHMIGFNQRVLELDAPGTEALWLSEGLAQMAEELVAGAYQARGDFAAAELFREGNEDRARRYLLAPDSVSLIVATGQGTLQERGAGWLFTLYLWDLDRDGGVLARLTRSTLTGVQNVAAVTGRSWPDILSAWASALYLDGLPTGPYAFEYPSVNLRGRIRTSTGSYPLVPERLSGDFRRSGSLWSSSVAHYIVVPPASGSLVLRLGGEGGGQAPAEANLRMRVVRLY